MTMPWNTVPQAPTQAPAGAYPTAPGGGFPAAPPGWPPQVPSAAAPPGAYPAAPPGWPPQAPAAAPPGYPAAPAAAPPQAYGPSFAGLGGDAADPGVRSHEIPFGRVRLETVKAEWVPKHQLLVVHFKVVACSDPSVPVGYECAWKRSTKTLPQNKGGDNMWQKGVNELIYPLLKVDANNPAHLAALKAKNPNTGLPIIEEVVKEIFATNTVQGQPFAGRLVDCDCAPGVRTEKTPADKQPFPRQTFSIVAS